MFVRRSDAAGSQTVPPRMVTPDQDFRVRSEFDAERAELFLAPAALLVEGRCRARRKRIPFVALRDRDARRGRPPSKSEQRLNHLIAHVAGSDHAFALEPDFEGVAGLRGHTRKPHQAWSDFSRPPAAQMPDGLTRAARAVAELARERDKR